MLNYLLIRIYVNLFPVEASGLYFQVGLRFVPSLISPWCVLWSLLTPDGNC